MFHSATVTYRHTHTHIHTQACMHIPDPGAPRLPGGLVNSTVCVCPIHPSLNGEGTQRKEREADEKENGNNAEKS